MGFWALLPFSLCLSLGPLVGKVKEYQVETIVDTLCANMRSDKEQLRDIAGIGLKTILSELPPAATGTQASVLLLNPAVFQILGPGDSPLGSPHPCSPCASCMPLLLFTKCLPLNPSTLEAEAVVQ